MSATDRAHCEAPAVGCAGPSQPAASNALESCRLVVTRLSKNYGRVSVLQDATLEMNAGETLAVVGESGCGKTTLLKILAGLLIETSGEVRLNERSLRGIPPRDRGIVYLDQEPLLFEHLTIRENIAFAMRLKGINNEAVDVAVDEMLAAIALSDHAGKREWQLSGGQKQRVAFARAVLAAPRILLLDEPFSSLDGRARSSMRELFVSFRHRYSLTSIFVTHDVKEALLVGDRFALMTAGRLKTYPDRDAFLNDEATGIQRELRFWREIGGDGLSAAAPVDANGKSPA